MREQRNNGIYKIVHCVYIYIIPVGCLYAKIGFSSRILVYVVYNQVYNQYHFVVYYLSYSKLMPHCSGCVSLPILANIGST
jgi:hypothetical protein